MIEVSIVFKGTAKTYRMKCVDAYEDGAFYCLDDGRQTFKFPIADIMSVCEGHDHNLKGEND